MADIIYPDLSQLEGVAERFQITIDAHQRTEPISPSLSSHDSTAPPHDSTAATLLENSPNGTHHQESETQPSSVGHAPAGSGEGLAALTQP